MTGQIETTRSILIEQLMLPAAPSLSLFIFHFELFTRPPAILALASELNADPDELISLAGRVPPGVGNTLRVSEGARAFYRTTASLDLTEDDWRQLLDEARRRKGNP